MTFSIKRIYTFFFFKLKFSNEVKKDSKILIRIFKTLKKKKFLEKKLINIQKLYLSQILKEKGQKGLTGRVFLRIYGKNLKKIIIIIIPTSIGFHCISLKKNLNIYSLLVFKKIFIVHSKI